MTGKFLGRLAIAKVGLLFALASGPASAADLGGKVPMPEPLPIEKSPAWEGLYFGGHAGGIIDGDDDFTGGLQLGYNWQRGNLVLGPEADISFADDVFGTVRGRLGVAHRKWLFYGTGGLALDEDDAGYVVGGGIDYKIASQTSIGVDALYYDIDNDDFTVVRGRLSWHFGGGSGY